MKEEEKQREKNEEKKEGREKRDVEVERSSKEKNVVFFFKQKTAYEIYQCDWSSDVCSSDLQLK